LPYWVTLKNDKPFCLVMDYDTTDTIREKHTTREPGKFSQINWVEYVKELEAAVLDAASQYGEVEDINTLPYAASPMKSSIVNKEVDDWPLCYTPEQCKGRGGCPKVPVCND
jgi:hypothetical protein